jgi:hypothetical protein
MHEWVSPVSISLRDLSVPHLQAGREMGRNVLAALGFTSGFTHMEWYRRHDGEVVFGEIGARPPGARVVDLMNFATDGDTYVGWANAVVHGSMDPLELRYNAGGIFKRARGEGRITRLDGLDELLARYGADVALVDLLPVGAPRRDWRSTVTGDGMVVVRHPELQRVIEMTEAFARDFQMYAA